MPELVPKQYFVVAFKYPGKSEAFAGSEDFVLPAGSSFYDINIAANELIMSFFKKILPDEVMDVLPIPSDIRIIPGRIIFQEET